MVVEDESTDIILRELIEAVDLDTSIFINEQELAAVCDLDPRDLKEIFEQLDLDKDGKISVEEFILNYKKFQSVAKANGSDSKKLLDKNDSVVQSNGNGRMHNNADERLHSNGDGDIRGKGSNGSSNMKSTPSTTPSKKLSEKKQTNADVRKTAEFYLGQEYLDDLYEIARSRNDPMLLESLESFLAATVEGLLQKQSDNEKLDTALKRATEKNSAIALELEAEMEHQVAMLEEKIRLEEQRKLEEQKQDAHAQMDKAQRELKEMERKVKDLEDQIETQKTEANIPEVIIEEIQSKDKENKILQKKLVEFQTQMALMRTEVAQMKAVYDEQADRLASERGTVLTCVSEQENLTRQLHLLHEANKRLHDTNDDLRSALDTKRSSSSFAEDSSCQFPRNSMHNSFRSDPGRRRSVNGSVSNNDTDEDSKTSIPYDEDDRHTPNTTHKHPTNQRVNETPLLAELMAVDKSYAMESPVPVRRDEGHSTANSTLIEPSSNVDKETFIKQLEILCETNKRLGESNDELRDALGLLSGQIRMDQELMRSSSSAGCRSTPITPVRTKQTDSERPQSTSSPRKVLLTKSGYHTTTSLPDMTADGPPKEQDENTYQHCRTLDEDGVTTSPMNNDDPDCSHDPSKSCSPSASTLISSPPTGQLSNKSENSSISVSRKPAPSERAAHFPCSHNSDEKRSGRYVRRKSDDSVNSNERTCDCGNEIYGSDISICDFCLDSITSAVDELTTDYASSLSDDGSTIYTGKDEETDLYNVTGDGIFPVPRLDESKGSYKQDKSIQCTDNRIHEPNTTRPRAMDKCSRLDCNDNDCRCLNSNDDSQRKSSHNSSLKSVNWEDLKDGNKSDSGSCKSGQQGDNLTLDKSLASSEIRKLPYDSSVTEKPHFDLCASATAAGLDESQLYSASLASGSLTSTIKSLNSVHTLDGSLQSQNKSHSSEDMNLGRSSDGSIPTKIDSVDNKSRQSFSISRSGSETEKCEVMSNDSAHPEERKEAEESSNKTSDDPKIVLRISLSEQDLRNIGLSDNNELNVNVSPTQIAFEQVSSPATEVTLHQEEAIPTTKSETSDVEKSTHDFDIPMKPDIFDTRPELRNHPQSNSHESTSTNSDTDASKTDISRVVNMLSETSKVIPPKLCVKCRHEIRLGKNGKAICFCNNKHNDVNRVSYRQLAESTILTDSDEDSNDFSEQEATSSIIRKRISSAGNQTQDATYETSDRHDEATTEHSDWISDGYSSHTILQGIEAELSMYARRQPDEMVDEDDMDDEELVRLVDQTNEDDVSVTDDPIYIEEKLLREPPIETRGHAVGADTSDDSMSDRATPDRMYKLVLAGNAAVGKSSFIIRLCRDKFYSALNSTLGVDFQMKSINCDGVKVALQLWDTAGQERFRSIAKSYFRRVDGVVLLYDVTCENSYVDVREWLESIQSSNSKEVPVIICGNKTDLRPDAIRNGMPVVTRQQGLKLAQDVNALFIETSAKDGTNINKSVIELTRKLLKIDDDEMREITINLEEKEKPKSRCCR